MVCVRACIRIRVDENKVYERYSRQQQRHIGTEKDQWDYSAMYMRVECFPIGICWELWQRENEIKQLHNLFC